MLWRIGNKIGNYNLDKIRLLQQFLLSSRSFKTFGVVKYLPMPRLSPSMQKGKILKWFIKPKDFVKSYQLILEISTKTLQEVNNEENESVMEIELLEDMFVADILVKEGEECKVGQAIASFCDEEEDILVVQQNKVNLSNFLGILLTILTLFFFFRDLPF